MLCHSSCNLILVGLLILMSCVSLADSCWGEEVSTELWILARMPPKMACLTLMWGLPLLIFLFFNTPGQDQGKRSAGQEEGGAAQAAG